MTLRLDFLGYHWPWWGDLFRMTHPDGRQARVYVDSVGETWVDVRRIPDGGFFHSERVEAWRAHNLAESAEKVLREQGFIDKHIADFAHHVRERN